MSGFEYGGYMGKILRVSLSQGKMVEEPLTKGFVESFVGGKGYAWYLFKELKPGIDPFSPENKIIFATGPLTGSTAPGFAGRHVVITKSPLTGIFLDSYAGGFFGARLKFAGFDAVIIEGKAEKPVYLWINDGKAELRDASKLWGKTTDETEKAVKEEVGDDKASVVTIGPAGENLVRFACISGDNGRESGRGGAGAVLGSKKLKAIAVSGTKKVEIAKTEDFERIASEVRELIRKGPVTSQALPALGTPVFVGFANMTGGWLVRNAQEGVFEKADEISGEKMAEKIVIRSLACYGCPIGCRKVSEIKTGPYAGTVIEGPEFEALCLLGANCGIGDLETIAYAAHLCDRLGMDVISTGSSISFAMELYEKGILSSKDTEGLDLRFGNGEALIEMIKRISERKGLGAILAEGTKRAAEKIGKGSDYYANQIKGMEHPAWEARAFWGHALSMAVSDRGACHLHSFVLGAELAGVPEKMDRFTIEGKPEAVKKNEEFIAANDTLIHCFFVLFTPLFPTHSVALLSSGTGMNFNEERFFRLGERLINLTRAFNVREGITRKDDVLPKRLMEKPHPTGPTKDMLITKEMLDKMLNEYYSLRGWDVNTGIPTKNKLIEVGLSDVAEELIKLGKIPP